LFKVRFTSGFVLGGGLSEVELISEFSVKMLSKKASISVESVEVSTVVFTRSIISLVLLESLEFYRRILDSNSILRSESLDKELENKGIMKTISRVYSSL